MDVHIDESDQEYPRANGTRKKPSRRRAREELGGDVTESSAKKDANGEAKLKIDKTNVDEIQRDKLEKVSKSEGRKGVGQKDENVLKGKSRRYSSYIFFSSL